MNPANLGKFNYGNECVLARIISPVYFTRLKWKLATQSLMTLRSSQNKEKFKTLTIQFLLI
jgi:hypothetical protein